MTQITQAKNYKSYVLINKYNSSYLNIKFRSKIDELIFQPCKQKNHPFQSGLKLTITITPYIN